MPHRKPLTSSLEDYLEAIFDIIDAREAVRPKDIAARLQVKQPSVTGALRILAEKKLINYEPYGIITLTAKGREIAQNVAKKHTVLKSFFTEILLIESTTADTLACQIEHMVGEDVLMRFLALSTYIDAHKKTCPDWPLYEKVAKTIRS